MDSLDFLPGTEFCRTHRWILRCPHDPRNEKQGQVHTFRTYYKRLANRAPLLPAHRPDRRTRFVVLYEVIGHFTFVEAIFSLRDGNYLGVHIQPESRIVAVSL